MESKEQNAWFFDQVILGIFYSPILLEDHLKERDNQSKEGKLEMIDLLNSLMAFSGIYNTREVSARGFREVPAHRWPA